MTRAFFKEHIDRLRLRTIDKFTVADVPRWIEENTTLRMQPFSFKNHEFQKKILSDTSQEVVVRKPSQVGLTEATMRLALATAAIRDYYTIIYTLPTSTLVTRMFSPRVDQVLTESPKLRALMNHESVDNTALKEIGTSKMYMQGSTSTSSPISIPADELIHDELDFSDPSIIEQYQSRLTASKYKVKKKFSTPTVPGYGVSAAFDESRRHYNFVKCNHCNHYFMPDYYKHVKIPDYTGELQDITKTMLATLRWQETFIICPKCGKEPSLQLEHREWVCENPTENYIAAGYQVTPFDAPNVIDLSYLVQASTMYERRSQFVNFNLGLPTEDKETALGIDELRGAIVPRSGVTGASYVMGIDVGHIYYVTVAALMPNGSLLIVHTEKVPMQTIRERRRELVQKYMPRITVVDAFPHGETVYSMQQEDKNLFAAVYTDMRSVELFQVRDKDEEDEKGQLQLRQVNVNRNYAFDVLMEDVRAGRVKKLTDENDTEWVEHMADMKRVPQFRRNSDEVRYVWSKSAGGDDHFHHSLLYTKIASQMLGVGSFQGQHVPLMSTFREKPKR